MRRNKLLIITPEFSTIGGVSSLYNILKPFFDTNFVEFFHAGSRQEASKGIIRVLFRIAGDYISFLKKLNKREHSTIILNPSLANKSLIRDGIFLLLAKLFNLKVIIFFHGWKKNTEQLIVFRFKCLFSLIYFQADTIIVLADQYKKVLDNIGYQGNLIVGNTCVDYQFASHFSQLKRTFEYGNKFKYTILYLNRIEKEKGVYEAINIFQAIRKRFENVQMIIAGSGSEFSSVKQYVTEKNIPDLLLLGYVSGFEKINVFKEADCYLFTSYSEGMPVSVLEAMTAGLPVITTPVGGLIDFFEPGKMGYMFSLEDEDLILKTIETLMNDQKQATDISKYNMVYANEHFSAFNLSKKICQIAGL
ncbi:conserved hypothetical protein [Desulfamplus magnetovallimortis]|uniref:Glycosyl transferase family 1 domain-containing protein n=1 Tax=Desulfamplus magnetovallimortis TaxID=1246637 RepID=A0A1W1H8J2_9BACT|nr:glycosyltransferase [Desulfamplus magnetovallimortis]SLM28698.1 conserved hypothetical protein [Desulfamplus magnetovallimortis]